MKVLLDANVLYPTVMREVLLGVASAGLYHPLWTARILEEWARATRKLGPEAETQARAEVALLRANWPNSEINPSLGLETRLWLPDPDDVHVLAAAITGSADILLTMNASDFPQAVLREEGLTRRDPDQFLRALWADHPDQVAAAVANVRAQAERLSGQPWTTRNLLKKARMPKLGKALETA